MLTGCGGGSSAPPPPPPPPPTITSVTVITYQPFVQPGQTTFFLVTVTGTGGFSRTVTWSVNGVTGGDAVNGTIAGGVYTAPATLPDPNTVTVTATSVQDKTKSGDATATVYTISISPLNPTVLFGRQQQFTATVVGITNPGVRWSTNYGTIDANGLYTAPTVILSANEIDGVYAYVPAGGSSVSTTVTVKIPPPVLTSITPNGASANEPVTLNGHDLYGPTQVFFPGPNGTTLSPDFYVVSLDQINTTVPLGALNGPVYVTLTPTPGFNETSSSINFTRLPNLRIRAPRKDLSSSETVQFSYRLLGANSPTVVDWTTNLGNVSTSGLYQAPVVSKESFATVTACLENTRSCDATILRILPLRITPEAPVVALGDTLQLAAQQGSSQVSAQWSILGGGGSITPGGLFTAPTSIPQAGPVPVQANAGGTTATASVAVTGAFPGLVNRVYDYWDGNNQFLEGTVSDTMAVCGNRAYALNEGIRFSPPFNANPPFAAIEEYDITDPKNPVWLDAVDAISAKPRLMSCYDRYVFTVDVSSWVGQPSRIALYDMQSNPPGLVSYAYPPDLHLAFDNEGIIYGAPLDNYAGPTAPVYAFDIRGGTIIQREIDLPPPPGAAPGVPPSQVIGAGNLLYAAFVAISGDPFAVYDISTPTPTLLGSTPDVTPGSIRTSMVVANNLLFLNNVVFDISNPVPVEIGVLPTQDVQAVQGTRLVGRGTQYTYMSDANFKVLDITDPANPITESNLPDFPSVPIAKGGQLVGDYLLAVDGLGGIATFDLSATGSPLDRSRTAVWTEGFIFDQAINQQVLYTAGADAFGEGGLVNLDVSSGTPVFLGVLVYQQTEGFALQLSGTNLFLGLKDSLKTVNVANPASPFETGSLPLPTSALALSGNTLFVGTGNSRLVVLDVTNPNAPVTVASVGIAGPAVTMRLAGTLLFIADGPQGLLIFDVSQPATPALLSKVTLSAPVWDVAPSGSLALLAADSLGLVIADVSNPLKPKQVSQTTLESYNPFPYWLTEGPRSLGFSVKTQNGIAWVGTALSAGLVFGFDYAQPAHPRLVSMESYGEFVYTDISGFSFSGNNMYVAGVLGVLTGLVQVDISSSRNSINLYTPPYALRGNGFLGRRGAAKKFQHPKFDRSMWAHLGRQNQTALPQTKDLMCHACRRRRTNEGTLGEQ